MPFRNYKNTQPGKFSVDKQLQKYAGLNMGAIFKEFYDVMLSTPDFAVFFVDDAQIQSLIIRQEKFLLDSFTLDNSEIKSRYIKLGEMHFDINIPYADYMAGMNILETGIINAVARQNESDDLLAFTLQFFKQIRAYTAKGYLNKMLVSDINDIDLYLGHVQRSSDIDTLLATERVIWLKNVIKAIQLEDRSAAPDLYLPIEILSVIKSSTDGDPKLAAYASEVSSRMETNARNVFYFIENGGYEEVLPLYRELMSIYKLTLMLTNVVTIASTNSIVKSLTKDMLTGLLTRYSFNAIINRELSIAAAGQYQLAFIMVDIDHFKDINDKYGHAVGDDVLSHIARSAAESIRATDYGFRMGGEEFLFILKGAPHGVAVAQAEIMRSAIEKLEFTFDNEPVGVTVSAGVAVFGPGFDLSIDQMVEVSDKRLFIAKRNGRNRIQSQD